MDDYDAATYGDRIADVYDTLYGELPFGGNLADTVARLLELAGGRPLLELGIGTGRVALPLLEGGAEVHGIDASEEMVARLRRKPGGDRIPVTIGDFADFALDTRFGAIYVVFNTFFALLTQDDQVSCFRAVTRHLLPDGAFVIEAFVPDVTRFTRGQNVSAVEVEPNEVSLDVSKHDPVLQRTDSQRVTIREDAVRLFPVRIRYAYVSELDLMARLADMRLRERWADWDRTPFGEGAGKHVSVYELDR
jgi:SAM-dependent methyltransferase